MIIFSSNSTPILLECFNSPTNSGIVTPIFQGWHFIQSGKSTVLSMGSMLRDYAIHYWPMSSFKAYMGSGFTNA